MHKINQPALLKHAAVIAISASLTLTSYPALAFSWSNPNSATQPTMSITMLRYDAGVLNIQVPVANITPHWEIWDSKTDGQPSKMIIVDIPGLSPAHLPGFKQQLEIQAASMKLAHPEFLRMVVINTQPETVRLMLEIVNAKENNLQPRLTVSSIPPVNIQPNVIPSLSNVRLYLSPPISLAPLTSQALATTFVISPLEHDVPANIESPKTPEPVQQEAVIGPEPVQVNPTEKASVVTPVTTKETSVTIQPPVVVPVTTSIPPSAPVVSHVTPAPQKAPSIPVVATSTTSATSYEQQVQTLEAALANVRKTLQGKESSLSLLKQQQAKSQQEVTALKQQLLLKQNELAAKAKVKPEPVTAKPVPVVPTPVKAQPPNSAQASTTLFLELQKAAKEKELLKNQLEQSKITIQSLKKESDALNAKLAQQATTMIKPAEEPYQLVAVTQPASIIAPQNAETELDEEQVKKLEIEIQAHPDHWLAYSKLGRHYQNEGMWDDSERILKNLVLLDPQNTDGLAQLAMVYAYKGQWENSQKTLAALLSQFDRISEIPSGLYPDIVEAQQRIILAQLSK